MRERLAVARARSHMDVCASESWADPLGVSLLRGIDNDDPQSLSHAQFLLSRGLVGKYRITRRTAQRIASQVIVTLADQRCVICEGRKLIVNAFGVYNACHTCRATGLTGHKPTFWSALHERGLRQAMAAMGAALVTARASLV
jgi:hypothetical protein